MAGSAALAANSQAQGLVGIGAVDEDFESGVPFSATVSADFGWDSNANASSVDAEESAYTRAGIDARWLGGDRRTNLTLGGSFSAIYYFDDVRGADDDVFYNARLTADFRHQVNRRMMIGNNFYLTYEIEPDYTVGESGSRRTDQYLYGYNSTWLSYAWTRRFSTVTRYTLDGITYDKSIVGRSEDRLVQTFSQEGRYLLNALTTLVGEYRFAYANYDSINRDYTSNYLLAGFDHSFSRDLTGTLRAGAQIRDSDAYGSKTTPYGEFGLRYRTGKYSNLHWATRIGEEDAELTTYEERYSYRTSLSYNQEFTQHLRGNAGVTYVHNDFQKGIFGQGDYNEDIFAISLGLSYRITSNVDLNANYHFSTIASDDEFREYDRHRVSLGVSASF